MRFLLTGQEGMWCSTAYKLQEQGHDVRLFIESKEAQEHLLGMVPHVASIDEGLRWVGRDGVIIRDDEHDMSRFRRMGFRCVGGNAFTQKMESDRQFELSVCKQAGIMVPNFHAVRSIDEAIAFVKKHPDAYALKQMGALPKTWNYVGRDDDGGDLILQLEWFKKQPEYNKVRDKAAFLLQEVVDGVEFAIGAWWIGNDWKRRDDGTIVLEHNFEHKKVGDGDTGLTCGESGTVARFDSESRLFDETLEKLTPILLKECSDVSVNIDANCGVTAEGAYLFEITPRMGFPANTLQERLIAVDLGDFYADLADGVQGNFEQRDNWGVVLVLGSGQYPQETITNNHEGSFKDQPVRCEFDDYLWPLYVKQEPRESFYRIADHYEWVCAAVDDDPSIARANQRCVKKLEDVEVRAPVFRHDIGTKIQKHSIPQLEQWGYLDAREPAISRR